MILRTLAIVLLMAVAGIAHGALHKCQDAQGRTRYSDSPCPAASVVESQPMPGSPIAVVTEQGPSLPGIDATWLQRPAYAKGEIQCSGRSCFCGDQEYQQGNRDPEQWLLRAMESLPRQWDDYEAATAQLRLRAWNNVGQANHYGVTRASCQLRISQSIVHAHYEAYLSPLIAAPVSQPEVVIPAAKANTRCQRPSGDAANSGDAWLAYERCETQGLEERAHVQRLPSSKSYSLQRLQRALEALNAPRVGLRD